MAATALRPLSSVPRAVPLLLAAALLLQLLWQGGRPAPRARAQDLPPPPPLVALQLASLGEPAALSRATMLYVQGYDEQAGVSLAWRALDYGRLAAWLQRALELDPRSQYPLLAASEVYGAVSDPARSRLMLEFVYARFAEDPDRRWPWLAHAALVARHRLHDLPLARRYAQAIRLRATGPRVPAWARELEVFMAEDMNELDSARALIGGLLHDGLITDPHELRFLARRLDRLGPPPAPKR
ncbi:hypothetical protein [Duganella violaceipulchra]|uniref:Uncharacterized protein n=1 Tax=Duganella violaceipulchra TaxID=2849652 RepID=A0AA41L0R9_9BURK|nr:hypothetical protein [Duganella violaceicalia]MBV6323381.1 hypothetical protein [Duganella violaceicalia]MCP2007665.1 hypothetical protein [Duganella violaceicalia]